MDLKTVYGSENYQKLKTMTHDILNDISTKGLVMHNGRECVTGYSYAELYDWDMYFENIFLSYFGISQYCRNGVEMFLDMQLESGFIPRTAGRVYPKPRHHFKPFLAQTALLGCRQTKDYRWLQGNYYEKLKKYLDYWFWFCDYDKNGLSVWDGSSHSGMDNQTARLGHDGAMTVEGVDLNCYLVRELWAIAEIAKAIGRNADAIKFKAAADHLVERINTVFWDEESTFYFDRDERRNAPIKKLSVAGFTPIWLGIVPDDRAKALIELHLLNESEFWLTYPIATWAKNDIEYCQEPRVGERTWMGSTWIPANYMLFRGLLNYGYADKARELADKTFKLVTSETCLREYYNGENGAGQGLSPFWGWSSLGLLMPAELSLNYTASDILRQDIIAIGKELIEK